MSKSVCNLRNIVSVSLFFGAILKTTNSSTQKSMLFCLSIYMKKAMKLLAFIFEQPSQLMEMFLKKGCTRMFKFLVYFQILNLIQFINQY